MKLNVGGTEHSVASQGQANLNTVLGAIGTGNALMGGNGCGSGILGNIFGNGCGRNNGCYVDQQELAYATALAACQGREYALATARQEDALIFNESRRTDDQIAGVLKQTNEGLIAIGNGLSRLYAKVQCLEEKMSWMREEYTRNFVESKSYTDQKVQCEAQLRKAGDDAIAAWTQAELNKKISGELTINGSDINYKSCTPVLQQCGCGSSQNPYYVGATDAMVTAITKAVLAALPATA